MSPNRQPKGVSTGGQFAAQPHAEAEGVDLMVDDAVNLRSAEFAAKVGDVLGLEFELDDESEFDDWKAPIGYGRSLVISPQDTALISFVAADGTYHDAMIPNLDGDTVYLNFDNPAQTDRWVERVRRAVQSASSGVSLPDLVDSISDR